MSVPPAWPIAVHEVSTVVHLTAEYWPYARTGGLGEAVAGLAMAQSRAGQRVIVYVPLYRSIRERHVELVPVGAAFTVEIGSQQERVEVLRDPSTRFGPEVRFVDAPSYFDRPGLYGDEQGDYADNDQRFALFCLAALTDAATLDSRVSVIHAHDWHAALAPVFLRADPRFSELASSASAVVSVHNAAFQGQFERSALEEMHSLRELRETGGLEAFGRLNLLKGALTLADFVVTVSPTHAFDLTSELGGFGLHDAFRALGDRLVGITNGIDQRLWNPVNDPFIAAAYSAADLSGKAICKSALQIEYGLHEDDRIPLFAMSARLTEQKGFDIVLASDFVRSSNAQFVFLGTGERRYQDALRQLARERPTHVAAQFDFTDEREHKLLAGADFLLMPSLFEPCGLTQMRAQRYGVLVVARRVGGLSDTVDPDVGFIFDEYDPAQLSDALTQAEHAFQDEEMMTAMRQRAMARDFGWPAVVPAYDAVYNRAAGHSEVW
ncbi:MAG TPA: glycogen/starch synthase [Gemmatimonadaceae bacterium]|nr:glycogen/starch synthase [Gemmatimonadaceae bacterium]